MAAAAVNQSTSMEVDSGRDEDDLYTKMNELQTTHRFLTIRETYVKDETKNLRCEPSASPSPMPSPLSP